MSLDLERRERNIDDYFNARMIGRGAWKVNDPAWLEKRKAEWEIILPKLQHLEAPKRKLQVYEKYFMTGRIPQPHPYEDAPSICLFYLLWWHPDQSEENWNEIRETFRFIGRETEFEGYPVFWRQHYDESRAEFLVGAGSWTTMTPDEGFPDGFMGGLEERMLNFLVDVERIECTAMVYGDDTAFWLRDSGEQSNRYAVYQYDKAINRWFDCMMSGGFDKLVSSRRTSHWFVNFFDALAEFPLERRPEDDYKAIFVKKIRGLLERPNLPEPFSELWAKSKKAASLKEKRRRVLERINSQS